ncbi:MAG: hypothetical protein ACREAC_11945, partial [Blastocatellia bacterium]
MWRTASRLSRGLLEPEVLEVIAESFQAEEGRKLLVHPKDRVLAVGAENMVAVVDLFQHTLEFAAQPLVHAEAENLDDFVGQHANKTDVTGAFEQFVNGEVAAKDEIAAVLNLLNRIVAVEIDSFPISFGKLRPHHESPV